MCLGRTAVRGSRAHLGGRSLLAAGISSHSSSAATLHLLADPGCGPSLRRTVAGLLQPVAPDGPRLVQVSERESPRGCPAAPRGQPALAVVLFLREPGARRGGGALWLLQRRLSCPPWRYHHTEPTSPRRHILPYCPAAQDLYSLGGAPDLPLWAARQVHYGKEAVRFTLYCRDSTFSKTRALYAAVLGRDASLSRDGFCCFSLFCPRPACEVQLALKRLPPEGRPAPLPSALLEFRVRDLQALRRRLPGPCTPISLQRWQTLDYDGNRILLQVGPDSPVLWRSGLLSPVPGARPASPEGIPRWPAGPPSSGGPNRTALAPRAEISRERPRGCFWTCRCLEGTQPLCGCPVCPLASSGDSFTSSSSSGTLEPHSSSSFQLRSSSSPPSPHSDWSTRLLAPPPRTASVDLGFAVLHSGPSSSAGPALSGPWPHCRSESPMARGRLSPPATCCQPIPEQRRASCELPTTCGDEFYI
ncbi:protein FAM124A-like isoform X2 [Lepisosteus oculatus]